MHPLAEPGGREEGLVVFDAECPLCRSAVAFLARYDRRRRLRYLPFDTVEGREAAFLVQVDPAGPGSLVFVGAHGCSKESAAVLGILARMGGVWCVLSVAARCIPAPLRDRAYRAVAARRRRLFGGRSGPAV